MQEKTEAPDGHYWSGSELYYVSRNKRRGQFFACLLTTIACLYFLGIDYSLGTDIGKLLTPILIFAFAIGLSMPSSWSGGTIGFFMDRFDKDGNKF